MHEHIREQLVQMEVGRQEEMQSENVVQVDAKPAKHPVGGKHQYVYNQQVLGYCRYVTHSLFPFVNIEFGRQKY